MTATTRTVRPSPAVICFDRWLSGAEASAEDVPMRRSKRDRPVADKTGGTMDEAREGGCSCGEVRYRLDSRPLFTHCCHCLNCQRQTGSAFVINLLIETDRVHVLQGDPQPVDVARDDGSMQRIFR